MPPFIRKNIQVGLVISNIVQAKETRKHFPRVKKNSQANLVDSKNSPWVKSAGAWEAND